MAGPVTSACWPRRIQQPPVTRVKSFQWRPADLWQSHPSPVLPVDASEDSSTLRCQERCRNLEELRVAAGAPRNEKDLVTKGGLETTRRLSGQGDGEVLIARLDLQTQATLIRVSVPRRDQRSWPGVFGCLGCLDDDGVFADDGPGDASTGFELVVSVGAERALSGELPLLFGEKGDHAWSNGLTV